MLLLFAQVFASPPSTLSVLVVFGVVLFVFVVAIGWFIKSYLLICSLNEIIVLSGASYQRELTKGYRIIRRGRVFRIPLIETAHRMSLAPIFLSFSPYQLKTQDGCLLSVEISAYVKIASEMPLLLCAIERFLDRDVVEIRLVAQDVIEGHLGEEVASHTLQQIEKEGISSLAKRVRNSIESDFARLGLCLDTFSFPRFVVKEKPLHLSRESA
jgi:flotillin